MIYLVLLIYIIVLSFRFDKDKQLYKHKSKRIHQIILYLSLSLVAGLSYRLGIDCIRYEMKFDMIEPINQFSTLQLLLSSYDLDPLWAVLNSVVKFFSEEFYVLHLVVALFINGVIFWFVNKHSKYFFITILLYCLFQYWNFNFEILREAVSVSFFLLGLDNIIGGKKNYLRYYLLALPAVFFQTFGFVVLLLPIFKVLNVQKHLTSAIWVTILLTPVIFYFMNMITASGLLMEDASSKMESGYLDESSSFNIFGIIISIATLVAPSLYMVSKTKGEVDESLRSFAILYPLLIITTYGYYMMYRMGNYVFIPFVICVGQYIHNALKMKDVKVFLVFLVFFVFSIRNSFNETTYRRYMPYSSVFDKKTDSRREQIFNDILY